MKEVVVKGKIKQGLRIASGLNLDPPIKLGMKLNNTIALQKPFFEQAGVEGIFEMYSGTINVDISPLTFKIVEPDYQVTCTWFEELTETFWFVKTLIDYEGKKYEGYIYYPCPSGVKSHDDDTVELLSRKIPGVGYGREISICVPGGKIKVVQT
ncbi:MAG: hypothetical protein A2843_02090 [Candidatus Wildermuthbacteria bacterium RIFCSPHIGHO2_01_FULL_48_27b]|uniref:Uncharacterized protein n=1 Tax=Candidatus Wildermuthbacteria bacterium RIFCSPHIGHO2_01_FULL_48_27b TaxID=1802447 RepID=A0A1G2QVG7_9BACT|nr:MAG: hypothetical protein A2843_02090 [Candidatus Wildermuthbacteria bacterium RIFCSPHIGHO2_01_FULL_48_27b]